MTQPSQPFHNLRIRKSGVDATIGIHVRALVSSVQGVLHLDDTSAGQELSPAERASSG
jgi:hypothetical protein